MKRIGKVISTIWREIVLGIVLGLMAGISTVAGLSILTSGISENAIGLYSAFLILSAALGGPLSGPISVFLFVSTLALFGSPEMKAVITVPEIFWSNIFALSLALVLVSLAYRSLYRRVIMPWRLILWAGVVIGYYLINISMSITAQYLWLGDPTVEIIPAIRYSYGTYVLQAGFDILLTSLVLVALPTAYSRPSWYGQENDLKQGITSQDRKQEEGL